MKPLMVTARACFLLTLLVLASCVSQRRLPPAQQLPAPAALGVTASFSQLIMATFKGRKQPLLAQLEVSPEKVVVVIMLPTGVRLLAANYDGENIETDSLPLPGVPVTPERVLNDIMMAYWPVASWQPLLQQRGQQLIVGDDQRQLFAVDGEPIYQIDYRGDGADNWSRVTTLKNLQYGYVLTITPLGDSADE